MGLLVCLVGLSTAQASLTEPVRLISIGNSIAEGGGSFTTTGFNKVLNDLLVGSGISYDFLGSRYRHSSGAAGRGRIINGQAINEVTGLVDPLFEPWMQHYGIGGSGADNPSQYSGGVNDFRTEPYSTRHSLVDRFVDRADPFNVNSIRDPLNPNVNSGADGDFQTAVWGEQSGGAAVAAPNVILLHIGTNTLLENKSVTEATTQLNTLLRVFDLLRTTAKADGSGDTYLPGNTHIALAQIIPTFTLSGSGTSETALDRSFNYNADIGNKSSSVYANLSTPFKDQIVTVNQFAITANTMLTDAVRAAALTFDVNLDTDVEILNVLDPDLDGLVDWVTTLSGDPYNELTGSPPSIGDLNLLSNTNLLTDMIHPTSLGYAVMAEVWQQQFFTPFVVPEPGSALLLLAGTSLLFVRRRR